MIPANNLIRERETGHREQNIIQLSLSMKSVLN